MQHHEIRVETSARYHGLPVTIAGESLQRLAVIARYDTEHEITLGHITLEQGTPRAPYRVQGCPRALQTVHDAADHVIARSEALDRRDPRHA